MSQTFLNIRLMLRAYLVFSAAAQEVDCACDEGKEEEGGEGGWEDYYGG
jgi:hypothetical protein